MTTEFTTQTVSVIVNGNRVTKQVEPRLLLVHFIRDVLALTGTRRRVRHHQLRCLHHPPRRQVCEVLHDVRRPGRRDGNHDDRGDAGPRRGAAPHPEGVLGEPRAPVRVLHARDGYAGRLAAAREPGPHGGRGQAGDLREPLPLHWLSKYCKVHSRGCEIHAQRRKSPSLRANTREANL